MRKRISILLACLFLAGCSLEQLSKDDLTVSYIEEHTLSKDSSYTKILEWFALNSGSSESFIQMQNIDNGSIIGNATGHYKTEWATFGFNYTFSIRTKDHKTKFEFLIDKYYYGGYPPTEDKEQILISFTNLKNSIMDYMADREKDNF